MRTKDQLRRYIWVIDQAKKNLFPNSSKLSEKFEIHRSQAQRDLQEMRNPGSFNAPLEYDRENKGFFLTDGNYQIPGIWIDDEELILLAMAKEVLKDKDSRETLDRFMSRISSGQSATNIKKVKDHIFYKDTGSYKLQKGILLKILEAIINNKKIEITYNMIYRGSYSFTVKITPMHLVFYKGNWYLIGRFNEEFRNYSLSRISKVNITEETTETGKYLKELKKIIKRPFGIFLDGGKKMEEIELRFSKKMSGFARNYLFHPEQIIIDNEDRTCNVIFPSFLSPELTQEILKYGEDVKVIKPEKLKETVIEKLRKTIKQY